MPELEGAGSRATVDEHVSPIGKAANAEDAVRHFEGLLAYETDCWDVNDASRRRVGGLVILDVRSPVLYAAGRVPGAVNLPHGRIVARNLESYPDDTLFIVYCSGPHCNGAQRGAIRLAQLGLAVKLMIGGMSGWLDEGFAVARGAA